MDREIRSGGWSWLGIPNAGAAFFANIRFFAARQPGTPLRVLSLIAISAGLRSRGLALVSNRRRAVIRLMELGALLNDRFDGDEYDRARLREGVTWFANSEYRDVVRCYVKRLRHLESTRPSAGGSGVCVRLYRENVNHISLAALWALGTDRSLAMAAIEFERESDLRLLFQIVMLLQVIDDVLDRRKDLRRGLPSLATGGNVNSAALQALVSIYGDASRVRYDRDFCLQVALKIIAAGARLVIGVRGGGA